MAAFSACESRGEAWSGVECGRHGGVWPFWGLRVRVGAFAGVWVVLVMCEGVWKIGEGEMSWEIGRGWNGGDALRCGECCRGEGSRSATQ